MRTFESALADWIAGITSSKDLAVYLANTALQHFVDCGDTSKLQTLMEAFETHGKNYVRITAFKKWLAAHAPVTMKDNKLVKIVGGEIDANKIEQALATPFWEFAPDPELFEFTGDDVTKAVNQLVKRFSNPDKSKPHDEAAVKRFAKLQQFAATLH